MVVAYLFNITAELENLDDINSPTEICLHFVDVNGNTIRLKQPPFDSYFLVSFTVPKLDQQVDHESVQLGLLAALESLCNTRFPSAAPNIKIVPAQRVRAQGSEYLAKSRVSPYKESSLLCVTGPSIAMFKREIQELIKRNKLTSMRAEKQKKQDSGTHVEDYMRTLMQNDPTYLIENLFEHDIEAVPAYMIQTGMRCGRWYWLDKSQISTHKGTTKGSSSDQDWDIIQPASEDWNAKQPPLRVMAWDIETHKAPLKFPQVSVDPIMSISYYTNVGGYLLINRDYFSRDINDFTFTFNTEFRVHNFPEEKALLEFFLWHVEKICRPHVIVSYNGDSFDFPYVMERCTRHGLSLKEQWGFAPTQVPPNNPMIKPAFISPRTLHMDCLRWVERDSYLPCGSRGLKAVARVKLGYEPKEVDPELMVDYCWNKPQQMADYSVSDSLATYKLYMQYVHSFTLALSSIIPLPPDDVLRKGSGTLCEFLLMAEAYRRKILIPNKMTEADENWLDEETLLFSETYVGGQVEQLRSGIYREDIPENFIFDPEVVDQLINDLDNLHEVWLEREVKPALNIGNTSDFQLIDSTWMSEIKPEIQRRLTSYKLAKTQTIEPLIYHVDVGAMYPNIILSQRLQPYSIIKPSEECSRCEYYQEKSECLRPLSWRWRGEKYNLNKYIIKSISDQLALEKFPLPSLIGDKEEMVLFSKLPWRLQREIKTDRLKLVSAKLNKNKFKTSIENFRDGFVCQRQNSFYVDTVRDFRDRRLVYKALKKKADKKLAQATMENLAALTAESITYDSLQLAHKCILNSFYGYVMRKGARWYSLQMAAIVTHTGSEIIKLARDICKGVGLPLELDTDGVWTLLPKGFPDSFNVKISYSIGPTEEPLVRSFNLSYPCWMLNSLVERRWANPQFQTWNGSSFKASCENSVFFEIDGPYKGIFLPASEKENQQLKKRYAVFDSVGELCELKGFELKRRGELELLKKFQIEVFPSFLAGLNRIECFRAVGRVADNWWTFVKTKGLKSRDLLSILSLLAESTNMKKSAQEQINKGYKSMGITTAIRLNELQKDNETYLTDANVRCTYVVIKFPLTATRTERAVPISVFFLEPQELAHWLKRWSHEETAQPIAWSKKEAQGDDSEKAEKLPLELLREYIDWDYYAERLATTIQKIVVIPALQQGLENPTIVQAPSWCTSLTSQDSRQTALMSFFKKKEIKLAKNELEMSDEEEGLEIQVEEEVAENDDSENKRADARKNVCHDWKKYLSSLKLATVAVRHRPVADATNWLAKDSFWLEDIVIGADDTSRAIVRNKSVNRLISVPIVLPRTVIIHGVARMAGKSWNVLDRRSSVKAKGDVQQEALFGAARARAPRASIGIHEPGFCLDTVHYRIESGKKEAVDLITNKSNDSNLLLALTKSYNTNPKDTLTIMEVPASLSSSPTLVQEVRLDLAQTKANYMSPYSHVIELVSRPSNEDRFLLTNSPSQIENDDSDHTLAGAIHAFLTIAGDEGIWCAFYLSRLNQAPKKITVITGQTRRLPKNLMKPRLAGAISYIKAKASKIWPENKDLMVGGQICSTIFFSMREMMEYAISRTRPGYSSSLIQMFIATESCRDHLTQSGQSMNDLDSVAISVNCVIPDIDAGEMTIDLNNRIFSTLTPFIDKFVAKAQNHVLTSLLPLATYFSSSSEEQVAADVSKELWKLECLMPNMYPDHIVYRHRIISEAKNLSPLILGGVWTDAGEKNNTKLLSWCREGVYRFYLAAIPFKRNALVETLIHLDELSDSFKPKAAVGALSHMLLKEKNQQKSNENLGYIKEQHHSGTELMLQILHNILMRYRKLKLLDDGAAILKYLANQSPDTYEQLCLTWLPLWRRQVLDQVHDISRTMRRKLQVIKVDLFGLLVMIPTRSSKDAHAFDRALTSTLNSKGILKEALDSQNHQYFSSGFILNDANYMFMNNEVEIAQISFPLLDALPFEIRDQVEETLKEFLTPLSSENTEKSLIQFDRAVVAFLQNEWLTTLESALSRVHVQGAAWLDTPNVKRKDGGVAFDLASQILYRITRLDNLSDECRELLHKESYIDQLLETLTLDVNCTTSRPYAAVGLLLANLQCDSCRTLIPQMLCFSGEEYQCPKCLYPIPSESIESTLVSFAELAYTSDRSLMIQRCEKCKKLNKSCLKQYCECGSRFQRDGDLDYKTIRQSLMQYAEKNSWVWLKAVLGELI